jgi:hypothetical protein
MRTRRTDRHDRAQHLFYILYYVCNELIVFWWLQGGTRTQVVSSWEAVKKGFVEGGVEVFLADETFLADYGRGRDVAVDVGGDVGGHGGELSVDYVVVIFAHGGDEDILNSRKRLLDLRSW